MSGAWWADGGRMQEFQSYLGQESTVQISSNDGVQSINYSTRSEQSEDRSVVKTGSTGGRMQAWNAALQLLKTHPFGVGTGDVTSSLAEIYEREGSLYAMKKNMNPHSIWLQVGVRLGWFAMLGMLIFFMAFGWKAIRLRGSEIAIWTLAVAMNGTVESLFELQQGVVAILFLGLLFSSGRRASKEA
jgi:O-antigen ligase